jgi:hypothetical protein
MTITREKTDSGVRPPSPRARSAWARQWWVLPFALYCVGFGIYGGGRFITFDPLLTVASIRPEFPWHYPVLAIHVLTGTVAVCLAWTQVWPWLRENHPGVHRKIGWVYYFAGVIPSGILAFPVAIMTTFGQGLRYGFLAMATLWAITTVAGFVAGIQHRFEDHKRWMYRNVAMTTSTITVRITQPIAIALTTWLLPATYAGQDRLVIVEGAVAGLWAAFVGHLLFVEWVVLRPRRRKRAAVARVRTAPAPVAGD